MEPEALSAGGRGPLGLGRGAHPRATDHIRVVVKWAGQHAGVQGNEQARHFEVRQLLLRPRPTRQRPAPTRRQSAIPRCRRQPVDAPASTQGQRHGRKGASNTQKPQWKRRKQSRRVEPTEAGQHAPSDAQTRARPDPGAPLDNPAGLIYRPRLHSAPQQEQDAPGTSAFRHQLQETPRHYFDPEAYRYHGFAALC